MKKTLLPMVQLTPTCRHMGAFRCASAYADNDSDALYLQVYCHGMDVTLNLTLPQLEHIAKVTRELAVEQDELQK